MNFPKRTQKHDALKVVKNGISYTLPEAWALTDSGSYTFRNKITDHAFAHGGDCVGDGKIDGRTIEVEFSMKGLTEEEHDEEVNRAYAAFSQTDYDLYCGRADRLYHVAGLSKIKHKFMDGFKQRWSEITVSLLLADPFRYEGRESKVTYEFPQDVKDANMVVYNLGSVDTPLTFTFIPMKKMPNITIWHREAKEKFSVADSLLIAPATLMVNGKEGTVWRGNANSINTFSGGFLHAKPGLNLFHYTGAAGKIEISYVNRWFV